LTTKTITKEAVVDQIIIEPKDPRDITPTEAEDLAQAIRTLNSNYDVRVLTEEQAGHVITWNEVLHIWLPNALFTTGAVVGTATVQELTKLSVEWARQRIKKKGVPKRPTYIAIYGPAGKLLKSVVVKHSTAEPEDHTEADRKNEKQ
jgi:hypothetical protein